MTNTKPRQKQIKLSHIKSKQKHINKMETYVLDKENNLAIKYYPTFPENKINELLTELYEAVKHVEENNLDFFKDDSEFMNYIYLLIIRKFTSLENEIPKDFSSQVSIMSQIIDIGLFRTLFDEVFSEDEVLKVFDRVEEKVSFSAKITEAIQKELAKLEKIENKEILKTPFNVLASPTDGMIQ